MSPTIHTGTPQTPQNPGTTEPKVQLEDLAAGLLWPTLLKAPAMAFSPPRWLLGIMAAFIIVLVGATHTAIFNPTEPTDPAGATDTYLGFQPVLHSMMSLNPTRMVYALSYAAQYHVNRISQDPWTTAALLIPIILVLGIFGHAITRSASIQYAHGRQTDTIGALSTALLAIRQITLATLGPLLACTILAALVMLIGLTLGLPVVNILGSVLYLLGLILSTLIVCILTLHVLTFPLTISALAIEGTDGFDALQRSYAYLIAKPIRLAMYTIILVALGTTITTIVATLAGWSIEMADTLVSTLTNDAGRRVITGDAKMAATEPFANQVITLSRSALELIVAGYALSLIFCSSTMAYLCIRRVCDGQDISEVWDPPTPQK